MIRPAAAVRGRSLEVPSRRMPGMSRLQTGNDRQDGNCYSHRFGRGSMANSRFENFDAVDSHLLRILAEDPRMPYAEIADRLQEAGHEMTSEGIRYRVSNLFEATTVFFLLDPEDLSWEIVRIAATATDKPGAKDACFELIADKRFWHVTRGLGTYDVYGVGMAPSMSEIEGLLTDIREADPVEALEYLVVTERSSSMDDYYLPGTE